MIESNVESSNLKRVGWHQDVLYIEFLGRPEGAPGRVYSYEGTPKKEYDAIVTAESAGKAFNGNVKGRYPYQQIEGWPEFGAP